MKSIFEFTSVIEFLRYRLGDATKRNGLKSGLAKRLNTQSSYISQILNETAKLSLEQGYEASHYFQMNTLESKYFLLMLQYERAGTEGLREFYKKEMKVVLESKDNFKKRLEDTESLTEAAKEIYYSEWLFLAIHVLVSIPEYSSADQISNKLGVAIEKVEQALQFLIDYDFISLINNRYAVGKRSVHLEKKSPHQFRHQLNWRLRAIQQIQSTMDDKNLNYAAVYSLSKADAEKIKENIMSLVKTNLQIVAPSKEEVIYCSVIDFFEI